MNESAQSNECNLSNLPKRSSLDGPLTRRFSIHDLSEESLRIDGIKGNFPGLFIF